VGVRFFVAFSRCARVEPAYAFNPHARRQASLPVMSGVYAADERSLKRQKVDMIPPSTGPHVFFAPCRGVRLARISGAASSVGPRISLAMECGAALQRQKYTEKRSAVSISSVNHHTILQIVRLLHHLHECPTNWSAARYRCASARDQRGGTKRVAERQNSRNTGPPLASCTCPTRTGSVIGK
jgi:hypothetical protein